MHRCALAFAALSVFAAAEAAAEPVKLRFGHPASPRSHVVAQMVIPWSDRVTKASEGTMEVAVFPGGQLGGNEVALDAVKSAVMDFGWINTAYYAGKFNRTEVGLLPFEVDRSAHASLAMWRLYEKGAFDGEYGDFKPLAIWAYPPQQIHSTFPVRKLEDLKGKKIGLGNDLAARLATRLGTTPVTVEFTEFYAALQRGTVNGIILQWTGVQPIRLWEVAKFHTEVKLLGAVTMIAMNKESYAKLPQKAKAVIDANSGEKWSREWGEFWDRVDGEGRELVAKQGNTIIQLDPAEEARWRAAIAPLTEEWIKATPKGAELLAAFRAERDRAAKGS
jgi:TRAP-type C4-dicarboxylate transport system substrate-binding protein